MSDDYNASAIDDLPGLWDGFARLVRSGLGISAFGVQVMNLPPDYATKSHNESESGQEELYVGLRGSGSVLLDDSGSELPVSSDHVVRVGPPVNRTLKSGPEGLRVLIVGGVPGGVYSAPEWTQQGEA
jgi:hypothetical protein